MNKLKKLKPLTIIMLMVLLTTSFVFGFSDVHKGDPLSEDIKIMKSGGYIAGYPDGTFRPEGNITRAEFVRMTNNIFSFSGHTVSNMFSDVQEGEWYYNDIMIAQQMGYILGYPDGTFRPDGNITKEETYAIIDRILSLEKAISNEEVKKADIKDGISPWARSSVLRMVAAGLISPDMKGELQSQLRINRGQVVSVYARVLEKVIQKEWDHEYFPGITDSEYDLMIKRTISSLKDIINDNVLTENKLKKGNIAEQKLFLNKLITNMQTYLNNKSGYDMEQELADMKSEYQNMTQTDREELKRVIVANVDIINLNKLRSFFGF